MMQPANPFFVSSWLTFSHVDLRFVSKNWRDDRSYPEFLE